MSIGHQGSPLETATLVDEFTAALRPGGDMEDLTGPAGAIELVAKTARTTNLADVTRLAAVEVVLPRGRHWVIEGAVAVQGRPLPGGHGRQAQAAVGFGAGGGRAASG